MPRIKVRVIKKYLQIIVLACTLFCSSPTEAQHKDSVYAYIVACGIKHPEVVMQQCLLETGHLKSAYLMNRNNLFAFRVTEEYMHFANWKESVEYYKRWQDKYYKNKGENYYSFLKRYQYSGSSNYVDVLKRVSIKKG